jgi:hypothetical protein
MLSKEPIKNTGPWPRLGCRIAISRAWSSVGEKRVGCTADHAMLAQRGGQLQFILPGPSLTSSQLASHGEHTGGISGHRSELAYARAKDLWPLEKGIAITHPLGIGRAPVDRDRKSIQNISSSLLKRRVSRAQKEAQDVPSCISTPACRIRILDGLVGLHSTTFQMMGLSGDATTPSRVIFVAFRAQRTPNITTCNLLTSPPGTPVYQSKLRESKRKPSLERDHHATS